MNTDVSPARASARAPRRHGLLRGLAAALLIGLIVLVEAIGWRQERWHASLEGVRFIDHPEKISANAAAMTVRGYLVATVRSDVDFFRLASNETAHPKVEAALCDSDKPVSAWFDPLPREARPGSASYSYAILIPMRGRGVDLSRTPENVCLRFRAAAVNPLSWVHSKPVVVPLGPALREQLAAYEQRDGVVDLVLDPACAPQLCEPQFSARDLEP